MNYKENLIKLIPARGRCMNGKCHLFYCRACPVRSDCYLQNAEGIYEIAVNKFVETYGEEELVDALM